LTKTEITEVLNRHAETLMAHDGVVGVAIGETEDHTPCILIMLEDDLPELQRGLPDSIEGIPVRKVVTGEFRAL